MQSESRTCKNCAKAFTIELDDFGFYEKINVPPPTWCPECRFMRRIAFRNERNLYKNTCGLCHKDIISMYVPGSPFPVFCNPCWYSDTWDPMTYGMEVDFSKKMFPQMQALLSKVPRPALVGSNNIESPYVNYSTGLKRCYLLTGASDDEDCSYSYRVFNSKQSFDCFGLVDSELCVEDIQCFKGYQLGHSSYVENSVESLMLYDCKNLSNCIGCAGLRNKTNYILNSAVTQEEFASCRSQCGSYAYLSELKEKAQDIALQVPHRAHRVIQSLRSTGDDLNQTKNCQSCFVLRESENVKYGAFGSVLKDSMDLNFADNSELVYESSNIEQNYLKLFSLTSWFSREVSYCDLCFSAQNLFACVGIRSKQYCILNKQYTKGEYEALLSKIIEHMKASGEYGEFFPPTLSPFAYNETIAQEYFPLTKEQAVNKGYRWKDPEVRNYQITKQSADLKDHIKDIDEKILAEVIGCEHVGACSEQCTTAFKVTPAELQFYQRMNLPLPRLCPNCRHYQRLQQRNPLKLWHRVCMCKLGHLHGDQPCPNEFETSYDPDHSEIVYCEQCYQQEVV